MVCLVQYFVITTGWCLLYLSDEYVDFDPVKRWDTAYSLTIALVLFMAIMQLYQPMDFSQQLTALKVHSLLLHTLVFRVVSILPDLNFNIHCSFAVWNTLVQFLTFYMHLEIYVTLASLARPYPIQFVSEAFHSNQAAAYPSLAFRRNVGWVGWHIGLSHHK